MKSQKFRELWNANFPEAIPIGHELRGVYGNRWFRIHSLPGSKRYAETEDEYQIILERQNEIIEDLIGEGEQVVLLFTVYNDDVANENYTAISEFSEFHKVGLIKLQPGQDDEELSADIYVKETIWESHKRDQMLRAIADDEIRVMIICPHKNRIVYPYDGGVDLILESAKVRDNYKMKYKRWLSSHPQGL